MLISVPFGYKQKDGYKMAVKLSDVAEKAGVSLTTVSRVINYDKTMNVSKETEEKIWESVRELGYKVKKRKTKSQTNSRTKNIGYIVTKDEHSFDDSYFSDIIKGIESELIAQKCNLSFALSAEEFSDSAVREKGEPSACDGVIFIGDVPIEIYEYFYEKQIPAVEMFRGYGRFQNDKISLNFESTVYSIIQRLIDLGHSQIVYIGDISGYTPDKIRILEYEDRFRGYAMAMLANNRQLNPSLLLNINWDMENAYMETKKLLTSTADITAVFAANDRMAIGAMRAIQELGYSIPEDISIIGCDNIEFSQYVNPPLTTISYPREELGQEAVRILLDKLHLKSPVDNPCIRNVIFSTHIVERKTIAPQTLSIV